MSANCARSCLQTTTHSFMFANKNTPSLHALPQNQSYVLSQDTFTIDKLTDKTGQTTFDFNSHNHEDQMSKIPQQIYYPSLQTTVSSLHVVNHMILIKRYFSVKISSDFPSFIFPGCDCYIQCTILSIPRYLTTSIVL